ncbi:hypothetical protein VTO42DRAFT_6352 [Malbranchea cinnamomea]
MGVHGVLSHADIGLFVRKYIKQMPECAMFHFCLVASLLEHRLWNCGEDLRECRDLRPPNHLKVLFQSDKRGNTSTIDRARRFSTDPTSSPWSTEAILVEWSRTQLENLSIQD